MILSIGEILADMVGNDESGTLTFKAFCGGAPFNVAVNAKNAGAKIRAVSLINRVAIIFYQKANRLLPFTSIFLKKEKL